MNNDTSLTTAREAPCPICGETHYAWGELNRRDNVSFITPTRNVIAGIIGASDRFQLEARACRNCGNVQIFIRD